MKKLNKILIIFLSLIIIAGVLVCLFYFLQSRALADVFFPGQPDFVIHAELAQNPFARTRGLMFRKSLPADSGMLFVFPNEAIQSFWMKNTKIPLDLIFISVDDKIVDIKNNFLPCTVDSCPVYQSVAPAKYVLEINAGEVEKEGINIGMSIKIENN